MGLGKLLKFLFPKKDWELFEVDHAYWNTTVRTDFGTHQELNTVIYKIFYSKSKNEYKLVLSGYQPTEHEWYKYMLKRLNQLKNEKCRIGILPT